jgi:hypothetical protein
LYNWHNHGGYSALQTYEEIQMLASSCIFYNFPQ